MHPAAITGSA